MDLKKTGRTPKQSLIAYLIGFVVVFYISMLIGAAWTPGIDVGTWYDNFMTYIIGEHHFLVGITAITMKVAGVLEVAWLLGFLMYLTQIEHPFRGSEYGDAKWGNAKKFTAEYGNHETGADVNVRINFGDLADKEPAGGVVVNTKNYWIAEGVYINTDNDKTANLNMLVIGPPGSGKSFRLARPILSQLAGSFLVTDPKGELYKQTGQFFEDNGYEVFVLNVESEDAMVNSIHFNPFRYIRNESDIMSIAGILMKATTPPESTVGGDQFFEQSAEVLLTAIIYLIHYAYPPEQQNWMTFVELLESTIVKPDADGVITNDENGILQRFERANAAWKQTIDPETGELRTDNIPGYVDVAKYYNGSAETTSSIVGSLDAHCRYMKLKCVQKLLSEDQIDITNSFGYMRPSPQTPTGKRILFIVTSEDKRYYDWIPSMVYSLFFDELYHLTAIDPSLHEQLPHHLTFLMDEFANVTLPDSFVEKLSTMRSRNMSAVVIVQNLIQLKRKFPKFDMDKDLIGNQSIIEVLGAPDMDSCEYLSKHFGTMTINKQSTSTSLGKNGSHSESEDVLQKPLFPAEKLFAMTKSGPAAIIVKGTDPLLEQKVAFERSPLCPLLTRKSNPYIPKARETKKSLFNPDSNEQSAKVLSGSAAEKYLEDCEKRGVKVIKMTMDDLDIISSSMRHNIYPEESHGLDAKMITQLREESKQRIKEEELSVLNFDDYQGLQLETVMKLSNSGFSNQQIHALDPLIHLNTTANEILELVNPTMPTQKICDFARRYAEIKSAQNDSGNI